MSEYTIVFEREGKTVTVDEGTTLLQAAIDAGLEPNAPCGGAGKCKKCQMKVAGEIILSCQTKIDRDMVVDTMPEEKKEKAQLLQEGLLRPVDLATGVLPKADAPLLAAIDLGSTSIVLYLHDAFTGEQLGVQSALNPQRQYGGDVVQRANTAMEQGPEVLSSCVRITIDGLITELSKKIGRTPQDVVRLVMVGNSCMHHLFLEYPTNTLVLAPYMPHVKTPVTVKAESVGLHVHPEAELHWLSLIGGFVGADTVGCILAADMDKLDKLTLMVDIGTNGEMVLGNKHFMTATSTAAGPAFEGAKITCGMRGGDGAIDHTWIENGKICYHVIGGGDPIGICGSGLLDAVANLLELEEIDESGRMEETYYFTDKVFINQKDVRELQLAKAAIAAGIVLLCRYEGKKISDIEQLLLAGAFGNYLDPHSACAIGLLPKELEDRIIPVGNAAGAGAQIAVLNRGEERRSAEMAEKVKFVELANDPEFQDVYVDEMFFGEEDE